MSASEPADGGTERDTHGGEHRDRRPPWIEFRTALEGAGFRPSKRLGQNFLLDENTVRAIVRDAAVGVGDRVLEVGAGCGFLTLHLARAGVDLVSVEIDERLLAIAQDLLAGERVTWIRADVLAGKHALEPRVKAALPMQGAWHLVGNLPYSIAAPLLAVLAGLDGPPVTMTALVQREVAARIAARPGTPDWGALSIRLQLDYDPKIVRVVPASSFWPRPEVESAVVRLVARPERALRAERDSLGGLVDRLFQRRRQALGRVLAEIAGDRSTALRWLATIGVEARTRAEDLDLDTLRALNRARGTQ